MRIFDEEKWIKKFEEWRRWRMKEVDNESRREVENVNLFKERKYV